MNLKQTILIPFLAASTFLGAQHLPQRNAIRVGGGSHQSSAELNMSGTLGETFESVVRGQAFFNYTQPNQYYIYAGLGARVFDTRKKFTNTKGSAVVLTGGLQIVEDTFNLPTRALLAMRSEFGVVRDQFAFQSRAQYSVDPDGGYFNHHRILASTSYTQFLNDNWSLWFCAGGEYVFDPEQQRTQYFVQGGVQYKLFSLDLTSSTFTPFNLRFGLTLAPTIKREAYTGKKRFE